MVELWVTDRFSLALGHLHIKTWLGMSIGIGRSQEVQYKKQVVAQG